MHSLGIGEADYRVGTHARQEGWECRRWLGRLHPANGNQGYETGSHIRHKREKKKKQQLHDKCVVPVLQFVTKEHSSSISLLVRVG